MKRFFVLFAAMMLVSGVAMAQPYLGEYPNEIGVYTVADPDPMLAEEQACYMGATGAVTAYCVLTNPINLNLDTPMAAVGGFEFRLEADPPGTFVNVALHESARNYQQAPDYYCGANIPVDGPNVLLMTLTIFAMSADPIAFYISPVSDPDTQSIPGSIACTDYFDDFSISEAYPVTNDFTVPVFGMFECGAVVPNEDVSWGGVKTLFK